MVTKNEIQFFLTIGFVFSLLLYHLSNYFFDPIEKDLYIIFKITQISTLTTLFFLLIYRKIFIRLFLKEIFISGKYVGRSYKFDRSHKIRAGEETYIEEIKINQNLFSTTLIARSLDRETKELVSTWTGTLYRVEGNKFYFGIELSTGKLKEVGVLDMAIDSGTLSAFYFPGTTGTVSFCITAKKSV